MEDFMSSIDKYTAGIADNWASKLTDTDDSQKILDATILAIDGKFVHVDAGLKQEGKVPLQEFYVKGVLPELVVGGKVQVYREASSDGHSIAFSHVRARKELAWVKLEKLYHTKKTADGIVVSHAKGGYVVEVYGAPVFLPAKQLDIQGDIMGKSLEVRIVRMDRTNMSITAARKQAMESDDESGLQIGEIITAIITAVDQDGLILEYKNVKLHMNAKDYLYDFSGDMRSEFSIGQSLRVKVINIDKTVIKVGHKQLLTDPWVESIQYAGIATGSMLEANVDKIQHSGVYMLLDTKPVLLAYLPTEEISWSRKPVSPVEAIKLDQKYTVYIANIDKKHKMIRVSLRRCNTNPMTQFAQKTVVGTALEGTVKDVTVFGTTVKFKHDVEGVIPNAAYEVGKNIKVKISEIDSTKNKLVLESSDDVEKKFDAWDHVQVNTVLKFKITQVLEHQVLVAHESGLHGYIKRDELDAHDYQQDTLIYATVLDKDSKQKLLVISNQMDV